MITVVLLRATSEAGAVAALAEDRKRTKYTCLEPTYTLTPIAIETSRVFGPWTLQFLKDLGNWLRQAKTPIPILFRDSAERKRSIGAEKIGHDTSSLIFYSFYFYITLYD